VRVLNDQSYLVTCPYAVNTMVAFAIVKGGTAHELVLTTELSLDFNEDGEILRIVLRDLFGKEWPKEKIRVRLEDGESQPEFLKRVHRRLQQEANKSHTPKDSLAKVELAITTIAAVFKQEVIHARTEPRP
jgi:hypothetical protein